MTHAVKQETKNHSPENSLSTIEDNSIHENKFTDSRPETMQQKNLQNMANNSDRVKQLKTFQKLADKSAASSALQRKNQPEQFIQMKEEPENQSGLPDQLKSGIEHLSGYSMNDVKVHYNSNQPHQLNAHAYAQGTDIHLAAGQEKHLPHEAWHVVQQKQGRVKASQQLKGKASINDDPALEKEADIMGTKAMATPINSSFQKSNILLSSGNSAPVQRKIKIGEQEYTSKEGEPSEVDEAIKDEYTRFYLSEEEMKSHLVSKQPISAGLIKSRALWYRLPLLTNEFFVLGESHAGVTGPDIKEASNIQKPILYEAVSGWSVKDFEKKHTQQPTGDQGPDENSSKLLQALRAFDPNSKLHANNSNAKDEVPKIPEGQERTRDVARGTHRLVVKGEDGNPKWWKPQGSNETPANTYDAYKQALDAIKELFEKVFSEEINANTLEAYAPKLTARYTCLSTDAWKSSDLIEEIAELIEIKKTFWAATCKKLKEEYGKMQSTDVKDDLKAPDDKTLNTPDAYRNEYMFASIIKASKTNAFAFAAVGNNHLTALKERLDAKKIKYITKEDFYSKHSIDAV